MLTFTNKMKKQAPKAVHIFRRCYSEENIVKFQDYLRTSFFSDVYSENHPDAAFSRFHEWFCLLYKLCFPIIKIRKNTKANLNWITKGLRKSCTTNRCLRHKRPTRQAILNINLNIKNILNC